MHAIQKQHIVDVFVWVDDALASAGQTKITTKGGTLRDSELLTMLIWDGLTEPHQTLLGLYRWMSREYDDCFPHLPAYQNFVAHCHRLLPAVIRLLQASLSTAAQLRFVDSTMLPVCRSVRGDRHKVAKGVAAWGKNHQGWHYGFKLHAAIDADNRLAAIYFTPANESDVLQLKHLVNGTTKDGGGRHGLHRPGDQTTHLARLSLLGGFTTKTKANLALRQLAVVAPPAPSQD